MTNNINEEISNKMFENISEAHKQELLALEKEIENVFSKDQAKLIKELLLGFYRLTVLQEESSHAYIAISAAVEAFYLELVINKKIISEQEFNSIAEKLVAERYSALQKQQDELLAADQQGG